MFGGNVERFLMEREIGRTWALNGGWRAFWGFGVGAVRCAGARAVKAAGLVAASWPGFGGLD